jgi:hypothetical protein
MDMYREVIEHPWSIPDEIKKHLDLNSGHDRGRIWRIVPDKVNWKRHTGVDLSKATTEELVQLLAHPNGWHRDTASRLIYERQDKSAIPMLENRIKEYREPIGTLHRLAALTGLEALTTNDVITALQSKDEHVRERGLVLSERFLQSGVPPQAIWKSLEGLLFDESLRVRFQLAMTLGGIKDDRAPSLLAEMRASSKWICDAILASPPQLAFKIQKEGSNIKGGYQENLTPRLFEVSAERSD